MLSRPRALDPQPLSQTELQQHAQALLALIKTASAQQTHQVLSGVVDCLQGKGFEAEDLSGHFAAANDHFSLTHVQHLLTTDPKEGVALMQQAVEMIMLASVVNGDPKAIQGSIYVLNKFLQNVGCVRPPLLDDYGPYHLFLATLEESPPLRRMQTMLVDCVMHRPTIWRDLSLKLEQHLEFKACVLGHLLNRISDQEELTGVDHSIAYSLLGSAEVVTNKIYRLEYQENKGWVIGDGADEDSDDDPESEPYVDGPEEEEQDEEDDDGPDVSAESAEESPTGIGFLIRELRFSVMKFHARHGSIELVLDFCEESDESEQKGELVAELHRRFSGHASVSEDVSQEVGWAFDYLVTQYEEEPDFTASYIRHLTMLGLFQQAEEVLEELVSDPEREAESTVITPELYARLAVAALPDESAVLKYLSKFFESKDMFGNAPGFFNYATERLSAGLASPVIQDFLIERFKDIPESERRLITAPHASVLINAALGSKRFDVADDLQIAFSKSTQIYEFTTHAYLNVAQSFYQKGELVEATKCWEQAVRMMRLNPAESVSISSGMQNSPEMQENYIQLLRTSLLLRQDPFARGLLSGLISVVAAMNSSDMQAHCAGQISYVVSEAILQRAGCYESPALRAFFDFSLDPLVFDVAWIGQD